MAQLTIGEKGIPYLNVAQVWHATQTLGPGVRAVVWLQGCPFNCNGCLSPEWIPDIPAYRVTPGQLANELIQNPSIEGVTFSGGEPMLQAAGLVMLIQSMREKRPINLICFTGFSYEQLLEYPSGSSIRQLLKETDVLIDGAYVKALNDNRGLRGSSNQKIHYLTGRLVGYEFENSSRQVEVHINEKYTMMIGVPPIGLSESLNYWLEQFKRKTDIQERIDKEKKI